MRYLITFSYDGTNYQGYQKQKCGKTIQQEIEKVLSIINNKSISIHASGRTDAKVHAYNQKAHFDVEKDINIEKLKNSMNKMLPNDIYIKKVEKVKDGFHARFDVSKKIYEYKINVGEYNTFDRNYVYQYNKILDIDSMKEATKCLIGEHNFKSFTKTDVEKDDYIRIIYDICILEKDNIITLTFIGSGFLRYMVRNIVGTLIAVGEKKFSTGDVENILKKQDRKVAYKTANPEGLYLKDVIYTINTNN